MPVNIHEMSQQPLRRRGRLPRLRPCLALRNWATYISRYIAVEVDNPGRGKHVDDDNARVDFAEADDDDQRPDRRGDFRSSWDMYDFDTSILVVPAGSIPCAVNWATRSSGTPCETT